MLNKKISHKMIPIGVFIILFVLILALLLFIQFNTFSELNASIENIKIAQDQAKEQLTVLYNTKNLIFSIEETLTYLEKIIPESPNESELIKHIYDSLVSPYGNITNVSFGQEQVQDNLIELPINITFYGRYADMLQLLNNLETGNRLIRIDNISILEGSAGFPHLRVEIKITSFYKNSD